jgi:hypothetical protein
MDFEVAIVAVGFARQQALELALRRFGAQFVERRLGFLDDAVVALGLAELDQLHRVVIIALDPAIAFDQVVKPAAFADQRLRRLGIVPKLRLFGLFIQLVEPAGRGIPVKDASAASRAIS